MIAAEWEPINIIQHGERDVMYYIPSQIGRERTDIVQQLIFCRPRNPNIIKCGLTTDQTHANHCPNAASMLAQYIQFWASIETALIQRPVLTEGTYTWPRWSREIFAPMVMAGLFDLLGINEQNKYTAGVWLSGYCSYSALQRQYLLTSQGICLLYNWADTAFAQQYLSHASALVASYRNFAEPNAKAE